MFQSGRISTPSDTTEKIATAEDWPWIVHMDQVDDYDTLFGKSNLGCSGTILTDSWILTSAKCCESVGCSLARVFADDDWADFRKWHDLFKMTGLFFRK